MADILEDHDRFIDQEIYERDMFSLQGSNGNALTLLC
jgi:hypothetical protein